MATSVAAVLMGLAVPLAGPLVGPLAEPAAAARTTLPGGLDTTSLQTATVSVPVPAGVDPRWVTGALTVGEGSRGTVNLLVDGRVVRSVPARPWQRVALPVGRDDVRPDGTISLGVRFRPEGDRSGCRPVEEHEVRLTNLALLHQGAEAVDLDPAGFLPAAASRVDVVVPRNASDDVLDAALAAVGALAARYRAGVPVALTTADVVLPRTGAGQRVVRIGPGEAGSAPTTTAAVRFGLPNLSITGSGDDLRRAVLDVLAPAGDTTPRPAADSGAGAPAPVTRTLRELGATGRDTVLSGYGRSASVLEVPQDAFGGPVDRLDLQLTGTTTDVPAGTQARLDTYLDGRLVDSATLDEGGDLAVTTTVPGSRLAASTRLELVLTAVPEGGCASGTLLPLSVELDPDASVLTAELDARADGRGFTELPQALAGRLPVGLRGEGPDRTLAAADAALVVAGLQRAAAYPLEVGVVDPDELLADGHGLLVGAGAEDLDAADARLRPDPEGAPGAALQTARGPGRPLLVLGTLGPGSGRLRTWAADQVVRDGWQALTGDVLVSSGGAARPLAGLDPATVPGTSADATPSATADKDPEQRSYTAVAVAGAGLLVLVVGARSLLVLRRRRSAGTGVSGPAPRP
ncbi:cellulose biosynthesis cyclic di-GMP-binding regulatory protein BcsB [Nocardioides abyssi]|uniref:Cellulose biosynthesis cyclic di-GMP-binding regulatory protein BcsB n=1 Tax=Nocardioides abyssi TaxID=3058370 RepID=A0ABT8EPU0_9ACTN|nr:cellulose biosynthesis cyclic di-GMP-binding regulatory protein BcsB [Nocardioides abyssi]MDN4160172.1 cellulose biosynthesis cyclic di-GMP-binding regulatory protein BcsB [Nocardioides abyssi]